MINWKDVGVRALKTFWQAAVSYLIAVLAGVDFFGGEQDKTFWAGIALSAGSAGLSAVYNGVLKPLFSAEKIPLD